jgi:hypothetical protein
MVLDLGVAGSIELGVKRLRGDFPIVVNSDPREDQYLNQEVGEVPLASRRQE